MRGEDFFSRNETIAGAAALLAIGILQVWETYTLGQPNVPWRAPEEASGDDFSQFAAGCSVTRLRAKDREMLRFNSQSRRNPSSVPKSQPIAQVDQPLGQVIALRVDFVARPSHKSNLAAELGELFASAGLHQAGLQASLLLVSDREFRLVTLVMLWDGERFTPQRDRLVSWTSKLIANFADGSVRAVTNVAHFLLPQASTKLTLSDLRPAEIAELVAIVAAR